MFNLQARTAKQYKGFSRQRGAAAIWLGLLLIPIMGVTFLAVEGARYMHKSSRLKDAAQAAALAVTIDDKENIADEMATRYVRDYVRNISGVTVSTTKNYEPASDENGNLEKIEYEVVAVTTHSSWFASNFIPSFGETVNLGGSAVAAKFPFQLGDKVLDVVLVTDFSGSMNLPWSQASGNVSTKIESLKLAVDDLSSRVLVPIEGETEIRNRLAMVPFNLRVQDKINGHLYSGSQVRYDNTVNTGSNRSTYEEVDWAYWASWDFEDIKDCVSSRSDCPGNTNSERNAKRREARRIKHVMEHNQNDDRFGLEIPRYIDYSMSVDDMFNNKYDNPDLKFSFRSDTNELYSLGMVTYQGMETGTLFEIDGIGPYVIPLTSNSNNFEPFQDMVAWGSTAAYQGIIRGLQVLDSGRPSASSGAELLQEYDDKIKILIIISDGEDTLMMIFFPGLLVPGYVMMHETILEPRMAIYLLV
ncbi:protein TadG [Vibrio astriarenae]|nr:protein TadG [Vibrio sp. C7]